MTAQFSDLPEEIRLQILEIAAIADFKPRVVEIFFKSGQIYSRTLPPPLLQVCRLSRYVTLKIYKPWLPQFKGTTAHKQYESLIQEYGGKRLSRLNNVCISLERDLLVIDKQQWSKWNFGPLEHKLLRNMAINLDGWMGWISTVQLARRFKQLSKLYLCHRTNASEMAYFKMATIARGIKMSQKTHPDYIPPLVKLKSAPPVHLARRWDGDVQDWFTYKYPVGAPTHVRSNRSAKVRNRGCSTPLRTTKRASTQMAEETRAKKQLRSKSSIQLSRDRSHRDVVVTDLAHSVLFPERLSTRNTLKRKRQDDEMVRTHRVPRKAAKLSCPKKRTTPTQSRVVIGLVSHPRRRGCRSSSKSRDLNPTSEQHSSSLKKTTFWIPEPLSPTPEPRIILSPTPEVPGLEANARFRCPFDGIDDADLRVSLARTASPVVTPAFIDAHVALDGGGEAGSTTGEQENGRNACYDFQSIVSRETVEQLEDGLHCEQNNPSNFRNNTGTCCETPNLPVVKEDRFIDSGYAESFGVGEVAIENFTRAAISQPLFELNFGGLENDDISVVPKLLTSELEDAQPMISTLEDSSPEEEYEPERIVAERKTEEGVIEILIQWLGWPEEKDWTWEVEKTLEQSVPDLVASWRESKVQKEEPVSVEYIVEKILGKRKFKGVPHYLVAWKGFPLVKDRTWEPCQRLEVDVPHLVDAFEMKKKK
jgi:hypothetical protein